MEAEQSLLGALILDNKTLETISDFLREDHFFVPAHQRLFKAILNLYNRGQVADPITLKGYFENDGDLAPVGGAAYLSDLVGGVVSIYNTEHYGRMIYDLFLRRELIALGEDVITESMDQRSEIEAIQTIEQMESRLFKLAESGDARGGFISLRDSVKTALAYAEQAFKSDTHVTGCTTGLRDLDYKLGGLHPSDLLILAGRPSMGKTALAVNIAWRAAQKYAQTGGKEGAITGFFSLEMSADQLAGRILADQAEISGDSIRKGNLDQSQFNRMIEATQRMSQVPLYIDDTPALSIAAVRTRARRLKRQFGLGLLVIDYLQLLSGSGSSQSVSNRVNEVSEITRGLKAIAKELEIPVIALSQLSRAVEQREDKRPQLSDLRESGSIEQDSDVVMFVYRQSYYLEREQPDVEDTEKYAQWQEKMDRAHNKAEVIIAKQRHGPIGTVQMFFDGNYTRFGDLDKTHSDQEF
jgi:replicative DNA helicase